MSEEVMAAEELAGARFGPLSFRLMAGAGVIVHAHRFQGLADLLDVLTGLEPAERGTARLWGHDPARTGEHALLRSLGDIGYATGSAGMLANLKVWENLLLPLHARGERLPPTAELEDRILEAFAVCSLDEGWVRRAAAETPDQLGEYERVVCALVRCHVCGFRLLVCDRVFEGLDEQRRARLAGMIDWLGEQRPESALLLLHHGSEPLDGGFGLSRWEPIEMVAADSESWRDS